MSISRSASSYLTTPPSGSAGTPIAARDEPEIVGDSATMQRLRLQVRRIGPHFRTVLLTGERGTGKQLVARALHAMSPGAAGPFVVCHAAAIEDALVECEEGAGTPGDMGHLIKKAQRGTLFLGGINEMPLEVQSRLLRVLRQYESVQSRLHASERMELRLIASTSEDVKVLAATGRFRQELYQRLATVDIALPPMRERREDLPQLAMCFLGRFAVLYGSAVREIADEAMERMQEYCWPGNVGELESVLRNGVLQSEGKVLEPHHLPVFAEPNRSEPSMTGVAGSVRLQDVVEQHVVRVLKDCGGNKLRTAEVLGISRSTLYRMLDAGASANTLR
jgi:DNA-binding NtrC family response regulator